MVGAARDWPQWKDSVCGDVQLLFTRAYDFLRMAAISGSNIKLAGTHAGVSIGEDGPSQMGLEDIAMMCAEPIALSLYPPMRRRHGARLNWLSSTAGPCYLRLARMATPVF